MVMELIYYCQLFDLKEPLEAVYGQLEEGLLSFSSFIVEGAQLV